MKTLYIIAIAFIATQFTNAQVGIGTPNPDDSSILELYSDDKGLLLPRVSDPINDITLPATGLVVYDSTNKNIVVNTGTSAAPIWTKTANEGHLSVETGGANDADIASSTTGSPKVKIEGADNVAITESGNTITVGSAGKTTYKVVNSSSGTFQDGAFSESCTPQSQFNEGTYFSLDNYGGGNNYCLPNPNSNPGQVFFIRNISDTNDIYLVASNGNPTDRGFCKNSSFDCTNFFKVNFNSFPKTLMLVSDGANYSILNN